eukprot:TRINITY_DN3004_c0_g1_i1.p2 TRINITY_DN3004_c0_g1~~TRINITY_DN3004_c0_g1_i1.p2  ORF type:complete len:98 (-),score=25.94 TRINITY_DN3004_c0_g1_i1:234-527(-)
MDETSIREDSDESDVVKLALFEDEEVKEAPEKVDKGKTDVMKNREEPCALANDREPEKIEIEDMVASDVGNDLFEDFEHVSEIYKEQEPGIEEKYEF